MDRESRREARRWERDLAAQLRALPTYDGDTPDGGPVAAPAPLPRQRRGRRRARRPRRTVAAVAITTGLVLAIWLLNASPALTRLRAAVGLETGGSASSYAFMNTRPDGDPVTWSSCRPIRYVVNPEGAPDGWRDTVGDALAEIGAVSGLEFAFVGTTTDRDFGQGTPRGRDEPVLVGWASPSEVPLLAGNTVGVAGPVSWAARDDPSASYDTGAVVFDGPAFGEMERAHEEWLQQAIALHEFGHLVGLAHVDDERQQMYPSTTPRSDLGNGDREGLRRLGSGPCT